jgi:hypothetical protein
LEKGKGSHARLEERRLTRTAPALCFSQHGSPFDKLVRPAGIAPTPPDWQPGILLLDEDRERKGGAGCYSSTPAPPLMTKKNKHRCQLGFEFAPAGVFTAVVSMFQAHLPVRPLLVRQRRKASKVGKT